MISSLRWTIPAVLVGLAMILASCKTRYTVTPPPAGTGGGVKAAQPNAVPAPAPRPAADQDPLVLKGKQDWAPCGTCHGATDPRIPQDEDWVVMNEETT